MVNARNKTLPRFIFEIKTAERGLSLLVRLCQQSLLASHPEWNLMPGSTDHDQEKMLTVGERINKKKSAVQLYSTHLLCIPWRYLMFKHVLIVDLDYTVSG